MTDLKPIILIVDDNLLMRETLTLVCEDLGWKVFLAQNGSEALGKVEELSPHCVLIDLQMPGMDGFETAESIAEQFRQAKKPLPLLIGISGTVGPQERKCMESSAFESLLEKPPADHEILRIRERVLQKRENTGRLDPSVQQNLEVDAAKLHIILHDDMESLRLSLEMKDFESVRQQVHGFKSSAIAMKWEKIEQLCEGAESLALKKKDTAFHWGKLVLQELENKLAELQRDQPHTGGKQG